MFVCLFFIILGGGKKDLALIFFSVLQLVLANSHSKSSDQRILWLDENRITAGFILNKTLMQKWAMSSKCHVKLSRPSLEVDRT